MIDPVSKKSPSSHRYLPFLKRAARAQGLAVFVLGLCCGLSSAAVESRWHLAEDAGIAWEVKPQDVHQDNVEMSGKKVSVVVTYGVNANNHLSVSRQVVWPMLRFHPNKTHDHFVVTFGDDAAPRIFINERLVREQTLSRVWQKGILRFEGTIGRNRELAYSRAVFPSVDKPVCFDVTRYTNRSDKELAILIEQNERVVRTLPGHGVYGDYEASARVVGPGSKTLKPGESVSFTVVLSARGKDEPAPDLDVVAEEQSRRARLESFEARMQLETPDPVLNAMFNFAKIRVAESVYETRGGPMHGPGGATYYAAIWANDSAEYTYPFYAMLGDELAIASGLNSYRHFARFINPDYKPIPSSIISEGVGIWHGAGDRGDMAMLACGAARFALACGKKETAEELWPLIEWSLEYCRRKIDANGVVASDSDELENRFPSGKANLATSSLYFDGLNSAVFLGRDLGKDSQLLTRYKEQATAIHAAIERYFGANVEGFETYRYFDKATPSVSPRALALHAHYANEPDHLRAWIGVALAVGIHNRAGGTIDALLSPKLWTVDGLATESGKADFWDRSTLYSLRGIVAAGGIERALDRLTHYSTRRLLGEHVPYPVEAYPEGNQRHLSAEGALYCRIFTEGFFGIRPAGMHAFIVDPRLPKNWPGMSLRKVQAFGGTFDLGVSRIDGRLAVKLTRAGGKPREWSIAEGEEILVDLQAP
jgi:hypothetical protein